MSVTVYVCISCMHMSYVYYVIINIYIYIIYYIYTLDTYRFTYHIISSCSIMFDTTWPVRKTTVTMEGSYEVAETAMNR